MSYSLQGETPSPASYVIPMSSPLTSESLVPVYPPAGTGLLGIFEVFIAH